MVLLTKFNKQSVPRLPKAGLWNVGRPPALNAFPQAASRDAHLTSFRRGWVIPTFAICGINGSGRNSPWMFRIDCLVPAPQ